MSESIKIHKKTNGKDFLFIPVSHMAQESFYNDIENILKNNPNSIVIKEGRKENNEYLKNPNNREKIETLFAKLIYEQRRKTEIIAKKLGIDFVSQSNHLDEYKYGHKVVTPDITLEKFGNHLENFFKKEDISKALDIEKKTAEAINSRDSFSKEEQSALLNMLNKSTNSKKEPNEKVKQIQKPRSELLLQEVLKQSNLNNIDDSVIVIYGKQHIDYVLNYLNPAK